MRSLLLATVLGLLSLGVLGLTPTNAEATWWRNRSVVNYYYSPAPAYYAPTYSSYYVPPPVTPGLIYSGYTYYPNGSIYVGPLRPAYTPAYYYTPGQPTYYYTPGYVR